MARAKNAAKRDNSTKKNKQNGANVGYEAEPWRMTEALRGSIGATKHKHIALGLVFPTYISDVVSSYPLSSISRSAHLASGSDTKAKQETS